MTEGLIRKWIETFKNGRPNDVYDHERKERPSVITEKWVQKIYQKVLKNSRFKILT